MGCRPRPSLHKFNSNFFLLVSIFRGDIAFGDKCAASFAVYRRSYFFWELLIFLRKLGIIMARILNNPLMQCMLGIIVLFVSIQLQVIARPFETVINNRVEYLSIAIPLIVLYCGLLFYSGKLDTGFMTNFITYMVLVLFAVGLAVLLISVSVI